MQTCPNLVEAQAAFETSQSRGQDNQLFAPADVMADVWPGIAGTESRLAGVEKLTWLRKMAQSTQSIATTGGDINETFESNQ